MWTDELDFEANDLLFLFFRGFPHDFFRMMNSVFGCLFILFLSYYSRIHKLSDHSPPLKIPFGEERGTFHRVPSKCVSSHSHGSLTMVDADPLIRPYVAVVVPCGV